MRQSVKERLWSRVDKDGPLPQHRTDLGACWVWLGSTTKGYGTIADRHRRDMRYAHRVAWELTNGPIPDKLLVCHHCDNPPCVRPSHLFLGNHKTNADDARRKGRLRGHRPLLHCRRGHLFTAENTRHVSDGSRACRTCNRTSAALYRERQRLLRG